MVAAIWSLSLLQSPASRSFVSYCSPAYAPVGLAAAVGPVTGCVRHPVAGKLVMTLGAAVQAGYHVGATVTVAGAWTLVVGSAVQMGAVYDAPPVMWENVADG